MSKVDEIYALLKQGRPPSEIYKQFGRSSGPFFEALSRATEEKVKEFGEVREELAHVKIDLGKAQLSFKSLEQLRISYSHQVQELREQLKQMHEDEARAGAALKEFAKVGLEPTVALKIIQEHVDLTKENDELTRSIVEKAREIGKLDRSIEVSTDNLKKVQIRGTRELSAAGRALSSMRAETALIGQQKTFLNLEINRLSKMLGELEPRVANSMSEAGQLADRLRKMRLHLPKVRFLHDGLTKEVQTLEHARGWLAKVILVAGEKINRVLELEKIRGQKVDAAFSVKRLTQEGELARLRKQGAATIEVELRRMASERMENIPILEGRAAELQIQLVALGATIEERVVMLEELERSIVACPKGYVIGTS